MASKGHRSPDNTCSLTSQTKQPQGPEESWQHVGAGPWLGSARGGAAAPHDDCTAPGLGVAQPLSRHGRGTRVRSRSRSPLAALARERRSRSVSPGLARTGLVLPGQASSGLAWPPLPWPSLASSYFASSGLVSYLACLVSSQSSLVMLRALRTTCCVFYFASMLFWLTQHH